MGAIKKGGPHSGNNWKCPEQEQENDRADLLQNVRKNLSSDFEATRAEGSMNSLTKHFDSATRLGVDTPWRQNIQRRQSPSSNDSLPRRSPSPNPPRQSPFMRAGLENMTPRSQPKGMTQKMLMEQEGLRVEIESNMANLSTCHNNLTKLLEEEGYNLSDNDFEVELYDQRTVVAMTDPTLLDNDYVTRMNLMAQIRQFTIILS